MKNLSFIAVLLFVATILSSCGGGGAPDDSRLEEDVISYWKKTYPNQKVLTVTREGEPWENISIVDMKEKMQHNINCQVEVERKDGSTKTYSMSMHYLADVDGSNYMFTGAGVR